MFYADSVLGDVLIEESDRNLSKTSNDILLTGATGFIGVFLLRELLQSTNRTIHCIVRGATLEEAQQRLKKKLAQSKRETEKEREKQTNSYSCSFL
jgi:short-subunit dehydrogenase involved in D-alanine esterification of teichoic acids